jgi:hypothetical protein
MTGEWAAATIVVSVALMALTISLADLQRRLATVTGPVDTRAVVDVPGVGSLVPSFALLDATGAKVDPVELWRSSPVLLVFITPGCGPCASLSKELIQNGWNETVPLVAILPTPPGSPNELARRVHVLHQDQAQTASHALRPIGTPYGVVVDTRGRVRARGAAATGADLAALAASCLTSPRGVRRPWRALVPVIQHRNGGRLRM